MPYRCTACSHTMRKASPHGTCPACGSAQLRVIKSQQQVTPEKSRKTKIEIAIMVLLWGLLIYGIYDKFIAS